MFNPTYTFMMHGEFNDACFGDYQFASLEAITLFTSVCYAI